MLEDYQINENLRYENHYLHVADSDVHIGGVLGAALLSALVTDTPEGKKRGIAIDTEAERRAWIVLYEKEVRRDEWGLLDTEIRLLSEAYADMAVAQLTTADICPNILLQDLVHSVMIGYMHYLTVETFKDHIWECYEWEAPFAQWLINASRIETRRQVYRKTDWMDPAAVYALAERPNETEIPTLFFEGERADDIQKRYFTWMWTTYQANLREQPGAQPRAAKHRNYVVELESDWTFLTDEIAGLDEQQQQLWAQWMTDWQKYIRKRLKPERAVQFWEKDVSERQQRQLTQFIRIQEKEWDYFKCVSATIYALRQLGYVRRACSVRDITRWMTEQLVNDYTTKNNHDQFNRAWKELGRYTDDVKHFVQVLARIGVRKREAVVFGNRSH